MSAKLLIILLILICFGSGVFWFPKFAKADDPLCGTTITQNLTLNHNISCSSNGLIVGASGITIDGDGFSISGPGSSHTGIMISGSGDVTIKNFGNITGFSVAISISETSGRNTIQHNTIVGNSSGISADSSQNDLIDNSVRSNTSVGIILFNSPSTLTGNEMSGNNQNLIVEQNFNNIIDNTNLVEGKPVYYLYNRSDETYDGDVVGDMGIFWCVSCTNVTVKNAVLSPNNNYGVYLKNTNNSSIQNITASGNTAGIYLDHSSSNTLADNSFNSNETGISLWFSGSLNNPNIMNGNRTDSNTTGIKVVGSSYNEFSNNSSNSNFTGIQLNNSSNNSFENNIVSHNSLNIDDGGSNTYSGNQFLYNLDIAEQKMLAVIPSERTSTIGSPITFNFSTYDANGNACLVPACSYAGTAVSPNESLTISSSGGNTYSGSFTPHKPGVYSVIFNISDSNNNVTKQNYYFYVNGTESQKTYYFRDVNPTHGQPQAIGNDAGSFISIAPTTTEYLDCGIWVQASPDDLPIDYNHYLTLLTSAHVHGSYLSDKEVTLGIQKTVTYDYTNIDINSSPLPSPADYEFTPFDKSFTNINWPVPNENWYKLGIKLYGADQSYPFWQTTQADPSYANFSYVYSTTPDIKSNSNNKVLVISATASSVDSSDASVVLDGTGATNVVLDGHKRPFKNPATGNVTTTITSETATLAASGLDGQAALNSVKMDIIPNDGSINITIDTWNTSGSYYRKWTESSGDTESAAHTIGDLVPNTNYTVTNGDGWTQTFLSNGEGEIIFNYDAGYSTHTFELRDVTAPSAPTLNTVSSPTKVSSQTISGTKAADTSVWLNGGQIVPVDSSTEWSYLLTLTEGANDISTNTRDEAGNESEAVTSTIVYDATAPTLSISSPTNNTSTPSDSITIFGTSTDSIGIASLTINTVPVTLVNGGFSATASLNLGQNIFTIVSTDAAGNSTTKTLTIIRTAEANIAAIASIISKGNKAFSQTSITDNNVNLNTTSIVDLNSETTLSANSILTIYTQTPTFKGKATANSTITLTIHSDEEIIGRTVSDNSGAWQYTLEKKLSFGNHTIKIEAETPSGEKLTSNTFNFIIAKANAENSINLPTPAEVANGMSTQTKVLLGILAMIVLFFLLIINRQRHARV